MATQDQIDGFYHFASQRIDNGGADLTLDDLLIEWDSKCHRGEINAAIQEGLEDIEAGRTRPAHEVAEELRQKYSLPE